MTQICRAFLHRPKGAFPPNQRPLVDKTVQQVREKYGPESHASVNTAGITAVCVGFRQSRQAAFLYGPNRLSDLRNCYGQFK